MNFCTKCGAVRDKDKDACPLCSEKYQSEEQQGETQETDQLHDSVDTIEQNAPPKEVAPAVIEEKPPVTSKQEPTVAKSPKTKRPSVLLPLLVFLIAGMIIGGVVFSQLNRSLAMGRAVSNFGDEVMERINVSPLAALAILMESTNGGELRGEFTSNTYDDENDELLSTLSAVFSVISGANNSATAINASLNEGDNDFDISVFLSQTGAAFSTGMLDSDSFYGVEFDNLRRDFLAFADVVGLDWHESNRIIAQLESLQPDTSVFDFSSYARLFRNALLSTQQSAERVDLRIDGERVSVRRIDYVFDQSDLLYLLRQLHEEMRRDDQMRELFGNTFSGILRDIDWMIEDLAWGMEIEIVLSFYIGSRNRLMRVNLDVLSDREWGSVTLDLGRSVYCPWVFSVVSEDMRTSIEWNFSRDEGSENSIVIIEYDNHWIHGWTRISHIEVAIAWDNARENFTATFENQAIRLEHEFSGRLALTDNGFEFAFEYDGFSLEIEWDTSVEMPDFPENFVNISEWDQDFFDRAEYAFQPLIDLLLDALFGGWNNDWDWNDDWWWDWNDNDDWNDSPVTSGLTNDIIRGSWVLDVERTAAENLRWGVDVVREFGADWYHGAFLNFDGISGSYTGHVQWNFSGYRSDGPYIIGRFGLFPDYFSQLFWEILAGESDDVLNMYIDFGALSNVDFIDLYWVRCDGSTPPNEQQPPDEQPPQEDHPPILPPETPENLEEYADMLNALYWDEQTDEFRIRAFAYNNYLGFAMSMTGIYSAEDAEVLFDLMEFDVDLMEFDVDLMEEIMEDIEGFPFTIDGVIYQILSPTGEVLAYRVFR